MSWTITFGPKFFLLIFLLKKSANNESGSNRNTAVTEGQAGPKAHTTYANNGFWIRSWASTFQAERVMSTEALLFTREPVKIGRGMRINVSLEMV